MNKLRIITIVSQDKSDLFFANCLIKKLNVIGVIVEKQWEPDSASTLFTKTLSHLSKPRTLFIKSYNKIVNKLCDKYADYHKLKNITDFGEEGSKLFPTEGCTVIYTKGLKNINAPEYIEWLENIQPDVIAVCGASILREKILSIPKYGVLNLHGGLSQRYRGTRTTDWAINNKEPEYIGATVHFVTPGIDDGDIIYQGRPQIAPDDNPDSLYIKVVKLGVKMMIRAIRDLEEGRINASPLQKEGDLYLRRNYDANARVKTWKMIRRGVIQKYLVNKEERDKQVREMMTNVFPNSY